MAVRGIPAREVRVDRQSDHNQAETAGRLGRWEFLLVAAPLGVETGTGSPINALAIF